MHRDRRLTPLTVFLALSCALASGLAPGASSPSAAERDPDGKEDREYAVEETVTVTAERVPVPTAETGSSVTVLDRREIERRNVSWTIDLLESVPGVEVAQTGVDGKVATVFVRGGSGRQALVLIDGVRVNGATDAGFDLSSLRTDDVERIEVLRGPQSVLYGSEAMSGVISITTRGGADGLGARGIVRAGQDDLREVAAGVDGGHGPLTFSITGSTLRTDSVSVASERSGNVEVDPYDDAQASARVGYVLPAGDDLEASVRGVRATAALDGFALAGPVDDPDFEQDREGSQASVRWTSVRRGRFTPRVVLGASTDRFEGRDPSDPFNEYDIRNRIVSVDGQTDVSLGRVGDLLVGASYERRDGENRGAFDERVALAGVFLQHRRAWAEGLFVTVGVRHDDHSRFGGATTARAALSWSASARLRVHASAGSGFRAPSLNELYFPFLGVTTLDPERSLGADAGVEARFVGGRVVADLTAFRTEFDDLIEFDLGTFTFANVSEASARGIEASLSAEAASWADVRFAWTLQDTEDTSTGVPLARRPRNKASLVALLRPLERWSVRLAALSVRDRVDADGRDMDDYTRLDAALEYDARVVRPFVRIDNLTDETYEEVPGYTVPGLRVSAGVRFDTGRRR